MASLGLGRFLESRPFEVSATHPVTIAACVVLLALVASYVPGRRATRIAHGEALRREREAIP